MGTRAAAASERRAGQGRGDTLLLAWRVLFPERHVGKEVTERRTLPRALEVGSLGTWWLGYLLGDDLSPARASACPAFLPPRSDQSPTWRGLLFPETAWRGDGILPWPPVLQPLVGGRVDLSPLWG